MTHSDRERYSTEAEPGPGSEMPRRNFILNGIAAASLVSAGLANNEVMAAVKGQEIRLDAKPEPVTFDTSRTAMIVVDMQNDFGSKGGMFDRAGIDISGIQRAVPPTASAIVSARKLGIPVIYLKMGYRPDLSDLGAKDSVNRARHMRLGVGNAVKAPDGRDSRILIRDTWNTDIVDALKPEPQETVIYKTRFSGFYNTELDTILKKKGVRHLLFTGCTTSICVDSTVRDAMFRDYLPVLLSDCMSEPIGDGLPRSNHAASLLAVEVLLGWVSDSERLARAVQSRT